MYKRTLARHRLDGPGWAHPYGHGPFSPIVYADGGGGDGSGSASAGGDTTLAAAVAASTGQQEQQATQPTGQPAAQPQDPWEGFQWDGKVDSLPESVAKVIREAREEAGKSRVVAKQNAATEARQELISTISKAIGLEDGEKPPTPEELTQQLAQSHSALTTAQEQAAAAAIELHVYKTASRLGADADALLDSRQFCDQIDSIDPDLDPKGFNAAVEQAIQAALGRNPNFRAQSAGRSGADLSSGSGETGARQRPTSLSAAVRGAFNT